MPLIACRIKVIKLPIYLDHASTTPVDPRVVDTGCKNVFLLEGNFGNPASRSHEFGWKADEGCRRSKNKCSEILLIVMSEN